MVHDAYNSVDKLNPPPFVTTPLASPKIRSVILKSWSTLRRKSKVGEHSKILELELTELLAGFITRKGTQLRLEKALMLSNRIHKLGKRWLSNKWLHEYTAFDDGVQLSLAEKAVKRQIKPEEGKGSGIIRLPSRQWANWITYLTLRDCLILAKIKYECERTVKFWLGLISSSHHATDSLVAVGILSRIWYVSSSIVESLISVMYPTVCKLSIHLEPTKAENWLMDLETPSPEDLNSWMTEILGSPFVPARLSKGLDTILHGTAVESHTLDILMSDNSISISKKPTSSQTVSMTISAQGEKSDDEDVGVPVNSTSTSKQNLRKHPKVPSLLDESWNRFFSGHKSKLKTEQGKKQFCVRIRKKLKVETSKKVVIKLKRLRKCIKSGVYSEMIAMIKRLRKCLTSDGD